MPVPARATMGVFNTLVFGRISRFGLDPPNGRNCPRLWENAWDEAADALCSPARQLGCRIDRLTRAA